MALLVLLNEGYKFKTKFLENTIFQEETKLKQHYGYIQ